MIKAVFYFNQYKQGFSETYYIDTAFTPQAWVDAISLPALTQLTSWRDPATILWSVRATLVGGNRQTALRIIRGLYSGSGTTVGDADQCDVVSTDAVLRLNSITGISRRVFLRGLRDDFVKRDSTGNDKIEGNTLTGFNAYMSALKKISAQIRYTVLPPTGGAAWTQITTVTSANSKKTTLNPDPIAVLPAGWVPGAYLVFQGMAGHDLPKFPRTAQIVSVNSIPPVSVTVAYTCRVGGPFFPPKGRATLLVYGYTPIYDYQFERFSEHKTGKPFGALRGRSRALSRVV